MPSEDGLELVDESILDTTFDDDRLANLRAIAEGPDPAEQVQHIVVDAFTEQQEQLYRNAILETDWSETDILRIVMHQPRGPYPFDPEEPFAIEWPDYVIQRYAQRAPPLDVDVRSGTAEVVTITWPLLERLSEEHEEIAELLDQADGPEA